MKIYLIKAWCESRNDIASYYLNINKINGNKSFVPDMCAAYPWVNKTAAFANLRSIKAQQERLYQKYINDPTIMRFNKFKVVSISGKKLLEFLLYRRV